MDRSLSILVKFGMLDRLTGGMRSIGAGSRRAGADIAATRREITALNKASAGIKGFKDQEAKLQAIAGRLTKAKDLVGELTAKMAAAETPSAKLTKGLTGATAVMADLEKQMEDGGARLQVLAGKLSAAGIGVDDLAGDEGRLADRLHDANKRLSEQREQLDRVSQAREKMGASMERADRMKSAGTGAIVAGAAIGAPLIGAGKSAADFQSQLTDIGQKANIGRVETERMGRAFDTLSPKVAQLPSALAAGVDQLAGLGARLPDANRMIAPIGKAATAYKAEITDLANASFAGLDNLRVPVAQTEKMLDVMAQAGKAGAFEVRDMAKYFPALTASASALGQTGVAAVGDLAAALQITRKGAGDSATAANNLQNLLNKINTEDTIKNFKQFGVDLPAAMKKAAKDGRSPIEAIAELSKTALRGDLSKLSFLFGDAQVQAALRPLIQNIGLYRQIRSEALAANGTVETDFAERLNDANVQSAKLAATSSALGHRIGGILLPAATSAMAVIGDLADRAGAWAEAHPGLTKALVLSAAALAGILIVGGGLAILIGSLLGPFAMMRFAITAGLPGLAMFGRGLLFVTSGIVRMSAALLLNPWAWLIAGIAVAAYMIYTHWDSIKATFTAGVAWLGAKWAQLKAVFVGGLQWFVGLHVQFASAGGNLIMGLVNGFLGRLAYLKSKIVGVAQQVAGWFRNALGIKSPSRVFAGFGEFLTQGLTLGIDRGADGPVKRITKVARQMASAVVVGAAVPAIASPSATADRSAPAASAAPASYTFNIYPQPGQSAEDIARACAAELDRREREQSAKARSAYEDDN